MKITIIGVGKMGGTVAQVAQRKGNLLFLCDSLRQKTAGLVKKGAKFIPDAKEAARRGEVVVIAVKPKHVPELLENISTECAGKLIVSIAAGVRTSYIESKLGKSAKVIRVIPNLPMSVEAGVASYCVGKKTSKQDERIVRELFGSPGVCERIDEELMDAATVVGSSGPAFYAMMIEAMAAAGVREGLPRELALRLAAGACLGAGKMVLVGKKEPIEFAGMVATPGGITAEGLESLAKAGVWKSFGVAISRAVKKSKAIAKAAEKG